MPGRVFLLFAGIVCVLVGGCSGPADTYVSQLGSISPTIRNAASDSLLAMKDDPETVRKVIKVLKSRKNPTVISALQLLAAMGDTLASAPVSRKFGKSSGEVRMQALMTLGKIGGPTAEGTVVSALGDTSSAIRQIAVNALAEMHSLSTLDYVKRMCYDPSAGVRAGAFHALGKYCGVPGAGVRAVDFTDAVRDSSDVVRWTAVKALRMGWPDDMYAEDLLLHTLKEPSEVIRREVIICLAGKKCVAAVPRFKEMYDSASPEEKVTISKAIKALTGEKWPEQFKGKDAPAGKKTAPSR